MKNVFTLVAAMLLMMSADAQSMTEGENHNAFDPNAELIYHTAAPGIKIMPRADMEQMVMAYDVSFIPREGMVMVRWGHLDENGQGEGLWTRWRDTDDVLTFSKPGRYVLEAHAEGIGKENSSTIKATFKVDYMGMTYAPGIIMTPEGERGYYVSLYSPYGYDIYYRWRHFDDGVWNRWQLYTEAIPFTEASKYVLDANCEGDPLSVYIEVPSVDYCKPGDVNYNGIVDIEDVTALINMMMNEEFLIGTGDVNKDGTVSIADVTALIDLLLQVV